MRPKKLIGRYRADTFDWWKQADIEKFQAYWGGEIAATMLTKYPLRRSDAKDLSLLISNYLAAGNEKRLYNEESDLIVVDFDYEGASARLLGRDIAAISYRKTLEVIIGILNFETGNQSRYRLVEDMVKDPENIYYDFEEILQRLENLKTGLLERSKDV